jgi:hypothetical protein
MALPTLTVYGPTARDTLKLPPPPSANAELLWKYGLLYALTQDGREATDELLVKLAKAYLAELA